jgi:hypothetical protein
MSAPARTVSMNSAAGRRSPSKPAGRIPTDVPLPHVPDFGLALDPAILVGAGRSR